MVKNSPLSTEAELNMHHILLIPVLIHLILFVSPSLQVDIKFRNLRNRAADQNDPPYRATCHNLLPGQCCSPTWARGTAGEVDFSGLHPLEIAIVWRSEENPIHNPQNGCGGRVLQTRLGPIFPGGRWLFEWNFFYPGYGYLQQIPAAGASYIRLPQTLPPKVADGSFDWVGVTGIRALAYHGGSWIAKRDSGLKRYKRGDSPPGPEDWQISTSRSILTGGTVYFTNPPGVRYPDLIEADGKNYTDGGRGDMHYQSGDGVVLNLTALDIEMNS